MKHKWNNVPIAGGPGFLGFWCVRCGRVVKRDGDRVIAWATEFLGVWMDGPLPDCSEPTHVPESKSLVESMIQDMKPRNPVEEVREEVERRGYPEGIDYEDLILSEQDYWSPY